MKECRKCKTPKPLTEYYKDKKGKDGTRNNCKSCYRVQRGGNAELIIRTPVTVEEKRKRHREYYLKYKDNPIKLEQIKKQRKKYWTRDRTPEFIEERKRKHREYYQKNKYKYLASALANRTLTKSVDTNQFHHWSYNEEHWANVIELNVGLHNLLHRYLKYDSESKMYRAKLSNNILLDNRYKHIVYIRKVAALKGHEIHPGYELEL